jgi:5-methylcytosine-specific restriction endonuclease McrA
MVHCHHIIKRSDGRDDRLANLIGLCSVCHRLEHPEKQTRWTKRSAA